MKKRILAALLAASLCLALASCGENTEDTTTESTSVSSTQTSAESATSSTNTTETTQTTETTTEKTPEMPPTVTLSDDLVSVQAGKYLTLRYNGASAEVSFEVKKGVGTREIVTVEVTPHSDYLFDGFSEDDAIVNGKQAKSKELTYEITVSSAKTLFINTSMQIVYHENGGTKKSSFSGTDTFSAVFHQNPNTLPEQAYFTRDGYILTGYNTKADGTGEAVSLGSKATGGKGKIELYCMWEKNTPETEFETKAVGSGLKITGYKGNAETIVIPSKIGGKTVKGIDDYGFYNAQMKRIVIPSSVKTIGDEAFAGCEQLETLVLFDTVASISRDAFSDCKRLENVRINTATTLHSDWFSCGAAKIDRLMWAKDKKKIIIIGGSGSLYGYDSEIIAKALNDEYEIINFGENANISAIVYFDIAEDFVKEGDIVLWCPEPGLYTLGYPNCGNRFWEFRKSDYDFTKYINPQYYEDFYSSLGNFGASLTAAKYKSYDALSLNMSKYGDDLSPREWDGKKYSYSFHYDITGKEALTELVASINEKGASVYFSFAAMQESGMQGVKEADVLAYENKILSIPGIVSISDYEDMIFDDDAFWNSAWHLSREGAAERSEQVAEDLKKAIQAAS